MPSSLPTIQKDKRSWFVAHDWQLGVIIAIVVTLFLAFLIPLISTLSFMNNYHDFVRDVSASALYGREHGTTVITLDGQKQKVSFDGVSQVIGNISDAGVGRPSDDKPLGGVVITFGDGTSLSISPTSIVTESDKTVDGVLVRYKRADGSVYAYDTDRMTYEALCEMMHLPS